MSQGPDRGKKLPDALLPETGGEPTRVQAAANLAIQGTAEAAELAATQQALDELLALPCADIRFVAERPPRQANGAAFDPCNLSYESPCLRRRATGVAFMCT